MSGRGTERAYYDADVLVIGGGPAGLAAAIRARWVKGYRALVSSVALFDPSPPGGLLRWGGCVLSGPSWSEPGSLVLDRLAADLDRFSIPLIRREVVSIDRRDALFSLTLDDRTVWTGRSVVLATGFRPMRLSPSSFHNGVWMTYKGNDFLPSLLDAAAKQAGDGDLLIVGRWASSELLPFLFSIRRQGKKVSFLLEEETCSEGHSEVSSALRAFEALGPVYFGRLIGLETAAKGHPRRVLIEPFPRRMPREVDARTKRRASQWPSAACPAPRPDSAPEDAEAPRGRPAEHASRPAEGRLGLSWRQGDETPPPHAAPSPPWSIEVGAIFIDYRAFEISPYLNIRGKLPKRDRRGFIAVDASMGTSIPGFFAAGDITGRYASTLSALGDGVVAGFSAHRHAFRMKFGEEPRLFAYRADAGELQGNRGDLPKLPDAGVPIVLGDRIERTTAVLRALDDRTPLAELRARFDPQELDSTLERLIERKDLTIHVEGP